MDPLSSVLQDLRVRCLVPRVARMVTPWALSVSANGSDTSGLAREPAERSLDCPTLTASFYVITSGTMHFRFANGSETLSVQSGELLLLPHGGGHTVSSNGSPTFKTVRHAEPTEVARKPDLGDAAEMTIFITSELELDHPAVGSPLNSLPRLLHIQRRSDRSFNWLDEFVAMILRELGTPSPGHFAVIDRLVQILLLQAIREHYRQHQSEVPASALFDPELGPVLREMKASPSRPWTVESLAHQALMSRSAFASRFVQLVGDTPLKYLTKLRMKQAAELLRSSNAAIKQIAAAVGYESEAAFCSVFRRTFHTPPSTYRKHAHSSDELLI